MSILDDIARQLQGDIPLGIELIGQDSVREQLEPFIAGETPNILLLGPPGAGKTHLARWIAAQKQVGYVESLSPVAPHQAPRFGVWMLDECHRQKAPEPLFPVMENVLVTVIGATTRPDKLDPAFRDRFFLRLHLEPLSDEAREKYMRMLLPDAPISHLEALARASAGNPRQGERIAVAARALDSTEPSKVLSAVRINADGLNDVHMKILTTLARASRPLGLSTVALMARTDEMTVTEHEVLLVDLELVELSKQGRALTSKGKQYADRL